MASRLSARQFASLPPFRLAAVLLAGSLASCEDAPSGATADDDAEETGRPRPRVDAGRDDVEADPDDVQTSEDGDADGSNEAPDASTGDVSEADATDAEDVTTDVASTDVSSTDTGQIDAVDDVEPDVPLGPRPDDLETDTFACADRWEGSTIRIVEVLIDPNNAEGSRTGTEWFEITNVGDSAVDLDGSRVADLNSDEFVIGEEAQSFEGFYQRADDSEIAPDEWMPFYQRVLTIDCRGSSDPTCKLYVGEHFYVFRRAIDAESGGMAIGNSGDEIYIWDADGHLLDCFDYNSTDESEGFSWQRIPTEDGSDFTDERCLTYEVEHLRYNDNDDDERAGDYGTPGSPFRCW